MSGDDGFDEAAREALIEAELATEAAELKLRKAALHDAVRWAVISCGGMPAESARAVRDWLGDGVRELHALDPTAACGLAHLGQLLLASQFESCGLSRMRALNVSLYDDDRRRGAEDT